MARAKQDAAFPHEQRSAYRELAPDMLRARPETMQRFLAFVRGRFGSVQNLFAECGITDEHLNALKTNLLV
jgi:hypothetical protein